MKRLHQGFSKVMALVTALVAPEQRCLPLRLAAGHPKRKHLSLRSTTVLVAVLMAGNVWAQARKTNISCATDGSGNVTVNFKIGGVGNGDLCVISSGTYTANCACENGGGNCPSAENKQSTPTSAATGNVVSDRNG